VATAGRPSAAQLAGERAAAAAQVFVVDAADPVVEPDDVHHLLHVLRLRPGETVVAADGRGSWRRCRVGKVADRLLEPDGDVVREPAPVPPLTVAFAPVKGDRPEWVVQKLTELGVDRIAVLAAERAVVRWPTGKARHHLDRFGRVARAAAAQSRRVYLPEVTGPTGLPELAAAGGLALAQLGGGPARLDPPAVAVGPEGGWSEQELGLGLPLVGLGETVLRAETPAVAAAVLYTSLRRYREEDA